MKRSLTERAMPRAPNLGAEGAGVEPTGRRDPSRVHKDSAARKIALESCRVPDGDLQMLAWPSAGR